MTSIRKMEAIFLNSDWIAGITYNYAAFGLNLGNSGIIGFSMTSLSTPEDVVRTVEKPNGTGEYFDANDLALNISYARRLTNKFSLGEILNIYDKAFGMPMRILLLLTLAHFS